MTIRESFPEEEIRDGYSVDIARKQLWKIELDIMEEFDRICRKYDIRYFLIGGALIGAVRHKGFIPWDDDIDVGMFREDLMKFLRVAPEETGKRYYIQDGYSEPDYYSQIVRIRDKHSTGMRKIDMGRNCNNGIFIELYPFDHIIDSKFKRQKLGIRILHHLLYHDCYGRNTSLKATASLAVSKSAVKLFGKKRLYRWMQQRAGKYNHTATEYVNVMVTDYNFRYRYSDVCETVYADFEHLKLRIPAGYDNCLRTTYGDYMRFPPADQRNHHRGVIYYNSFVPYTDSGITELAKEYFLRSDQS